ncbi:NADP-dependent oxidoreductase domain-containing protein [Tricladium varicosporioides]|nr:NADP-dependent oxidoreductase domain-containing protein [Hymenoscyphus varicosporioides]
MLAKQIPLRKLGKNGPEVPALGLGLLGMSVAYGTVPSDEERFKILDRALELGCTFWDSADLYGDSEALLNKWFKRTGKRNEIFLATKFGFVKGKSINEIDSSAAYCKKACEESLKTLGTDYIDLYYLHHANPETPIEETMRALAELKSEGKIKYIALSEVSSATLRRACKIAPVAAVQLEYSPFVLNVEGLASTDNLLATCRELGVALVCYAPLGRGLLTSTFTSTKEAPKDEKDLRPTFFPRLKGENRDANAKVVNQFKTLADKKGCSISQLAIAWLLKQGEDIIPIPGTKKIKYLEENWESLDVHLTDVEEIEIRKFVESAELVGGRLPPTFDKPGTDTKEEI